MNIGKTQRLEVITDKPHGVYLKGPYSSDEVLLPRTFCPKDIKVGQMIDVFIYHDSEKRPIATTKKANIEVDQYGATSVKALTEFGAFLDWGVDKDIFLPYGEMAFPVEEGQGLLVYVGWDEKSQRVFASTKIKKHLSIEEQSPFIKGDCVEGEVAYYTDLGLNVLVEGKYWGLIFDSEIPKGKDFVGGQKVTLYVANVREDGKLDFTFNIVGYKSLRKDDDKVISRLKDAGGSLPFHDKSDPEDIRDHFGLSKKAFKKILGGLYKSGKIEILKDGIRLK